MTAFLPALLRLTHGFSKSPKVNYYQLEVNQSKIQGSKILLLKTCVEHVDGFGVEISQQVSFPLRE